MVPRQPLQQLGRLEWLGQRAQLHFLLLLIAGVTTWTSAEATQSGSYPKPEWTNQEVYRECGQNCHLKKGNEALTHQAVYASEYVQQLETLAANKKTEGQVRTELGAFCAEPSVETVQQCLKRFKYMQAVTLQKLRTSIVTNKHNSFQLQSQGQEAAPVFGKSEDRPKRSHLTEIEKTEDFKKRFPDMDQQFRQMISGQYQEWKEKLPFEPSKEDFIIFEKIEREPGSTTGESFVRAKIDPTTGGFAYDEKAYDAAIAQWRAAQAKVAGKDGTLRAHIDRIYPDGKQPPARFQAAAKAKPRALSPVGEQVFRATRNHVMKEAKKSMGLAADPVDRRPADQRTKVTRDPSLSKSGVPGTGADQAKAVADAGAGASVGHEQEVRDLDAANGGEKDIEVTDQERAMSSTDIFVSLQTEMNPKDDALQKQIDSFLNGVMTP